MKVTYKDCTHCAWRQLPATPGLSICIYKNKPLLQLFWRSRTVSCDSWAPILYDSIPE